MTISEELTVRVTEEATLVITRTFVAPAEQVWSAWTRAEKVTKWWSASGGELVSWDADATQGGRWRAVLRSTEGVELTQVGQFREVAAPRRLVFSLGSETPAGAELLVMVNLVVVGPRTEMTFRKGPFVSEADLALAQASWNEAFDRLATLLEPAAARGRKTRERQ